MVYSKVIANGFFLPEKVVKNNDLPSHLNTSDEWISSRTGIKQRYIAAEGETTSNLAAKSLLNALEGSNIELDSIDAVIVATTSPDVILPSTAVRVQRELGMKNIFAFDFNAVCSGFVYGVSIVDGLIKSGQAKRVALIGAETMSRVVDWNDRSTCVLFGDGAGCMIFESSTEPGILGCSLESDGELEDILCIKGGVSVGDFESKLVMNGREVFKVAVNNMSSSVANLLNSLGLKKDDIDFFVPHQANQRIISSIAQKMEIDMGKMVSTVESHANTSAASIPLAFCEYKNKGLIKPGQTVAFAALGAGITWGSCVIKL